MKKIKQIINTILNNNENYKMALLSWNNNKKELYNEWVRNRRDIDSHIYRNMYLKYASINNKPTYFKVLFKNIKRIIKGGK